MGYNLFLDDDKVRNPKVVSGWMPDSIKTLYIDKEWKRVWNYQEFTDIIKLLGIPQIVSFDHDLAIEHYAPEEKWNLPIEYETYTEKTGYDCMKFMVEYIIEKKCIPPRILIHSLNPVGAENIKNYYDNFLNHYTWGLNG